MTGTLLKALDALPRRRHLLVGVSGGCDSLTLLRALSEAGFDKVIVCYFNHRLRPGALDRRLAYLSARRFGYRFVSGSGDTRARADQRRLSLETAARELRFAFFRDCARQYRTRALVLAHHADDQEETILLNLFRGAGLRGLGGMAPHRRMGGIEIFRPWLDIPSKTIREAAQHWRIRFSEDPSNTDRSHTRNRLRHDLIPTIREIFGEPSRDSLLRMARIVRLEDGFLDSLVPAVSTEISVVTLRALPEAIARRWIRAWLLARGVPEPGWAEVSEVFRLIESATAKINLPGNLHARRRSGRIFIESSKKSGQQR